MQQGQIVENDESHAIFENLHAYTKTYCRRAERRAEPLKPTRRKSLAAKMSKCSPSAKVCRAQTHVKAVNDISLTVRRGETLGIVESGSGKTTLGRAMIGLQRAEGSITINGTNLSGASPAARRARQHMQIVFGPLWGAEPALAGGRHYRRGAGDP